MPVTRPRFNEVLFGRWNRPYTAASQIRGSAVDEIIGANEQGFKDLTKEDLLSLFQLEEPDKE